MYKFWNICKKIFNKTFFCVAVVVLALLIFFYWGWFEKQYDKARGMYFVYKGDKAYQKNKLQRAIDDYNRGLVLYPEHYGAWFNLGNIYVVYEDYYSAASAYEKAIEYNPKFTLAKMNLGIISAEKLGDFDGAINQYDSIINSKKRLWFIPFIFSNKKSEKINRGIAYYNMGIAYKQKSLYLSDEERNLANMYLMRAIQAYKNACRILKRDYDPRYNLALTYHLVGDYKNAGENYCKAIDLEPMNYEAHYNLAILLRHMKKYKASVEELEKAMILISTSSDENRSTYIFDILNDTTQNLIIHQDYSHMAEKIDDEDDIDKEPDIYLSNVTLVKGKIVAKKSLDNAMLNNFKTCGSKEIFTDYSDDFLLDN